MVLTASQSTITPKRHFWITDAALSNWREKVKNFPSMGDERLSQVIDGEVHSAIQGGKVEKIMDGEEEARLVHLTEGTDIYFALVKKSANPANGEFAVVTIMTPTQVEKKRQTQWSKPFGLDSESRKKLEAVKVSEPPPVISSTKTPQHLKPPERQPVGGEKPHSYLISYMPFRGNVDVNKREYEEYGTAEEVEKRITEVKIIPGTLRVYKQLAIGYRIIDE